MLKYVQQQIDVSLPPALPPFLFLSLKINLKIKYGPFIPNVDISLPPVPWAFAKALFWPSALLAHQCHPHTKHLYFQQVNLGRKGLPCPHRLPVNMNQDTFQPSKFTDDHVKLAHSR